MNTVNENVSVNKVVYSFYFMHCKEMLPGNFFFDGKEQHFDMIK